MKYGTRPILSISLGDFTDLMQFSGLVKIPFAFAFAESAHKPTFLMIPPCHQFTSERSPMQIFHFQRHLFAQVANDLCRCTERARICLLPLVRVTGCQRRLPLRHCNHANIPKKHCDSFTSMHVLDS